MRELHYTLTSPQGISQGPAVSLNIHLLLEQAEKHGVQWSEVPNAFTFRLEYEGKVRYFQYEMPTQTLQIGYATCLNKAATKEFLKQAGISVPNGYYIHFSNHDESEWLAIYAALQKPLVIKPSHGQKGTSVYMDIDDQETFLSACRTILAASNDEGHGAIIEEIHRGNEFRILATKEKVLGVIQRVPANIRGNGHQTIGELIAEKNRDPRRKGNVLDPLCPIKVDEHVLKCLEEQGYSLDSKPQPDQMVLLRHNSNISTGGDSIDVTDSVHPSVSDIAIRIVQAIPGIEYLGIDFITHDITQAQTPDSYTIIEVNSSPAFSIHDLPYQGKSRNTAVEILYLMYPELRSA